MNGARRAAPSAPCPLLQERVCEVAKRLARGGFLG
jgi:hypothetical protein